MHRLAALAVVCAGCAPEVGADRLGLAGGVADSELDAVVALETEGALFCSGTVVAPRVVLTATHCLAQVGSGAAIDVVVGADVASPVARIEVARARRHPDWRFDSLSDDIAVVALADDAPVPALAMSTRALTAADEGTEVVLAGYGLTSIDGGDDSGVRRRGRAPITGVRASQISINGGTGAPSACAGDSGGPSLLDEGGELRVAGVHSRASCSSLTQDERVDVHVADFIDPFIAEHPAAGGGCSGSPRTPPWPVAALLLLAGGAATGGRPRCRSRARSARRRRRSCAR